MYAAKNEHTEIRTYDATMDEYTPERLALYGQLRRAIDNNELVLHYQPKLAFGDGRVYGVEALVRWQHPTRGLSGPDAFISIAEQTGLIRPLTDWVLANALRQLDAWRSEGLELSVAINLSARSLIDAELPTRIFRALAQHQLPADVLELELTETMIMIDPGRALRVLGQLQARGIRIAVDDYGTGHSSLSYLRRLPIADLKIDKSFVIGMERDDSDDVIVRSTIELARDLNLRVVAEGVETVTALRRLQALGCDAAQGYYLGRPVAPETVRATIRDVEGRIAALAHDGTDAADAVSSVLAEHTTAT